MKNRIVNTICLLVSMAVIGPIGCGKEAGPPPLLPVEQIPSELQRAFSNAEAEAKDTVGRLNSALQGKDYPAAFQEVQVLSRLPGETGEQRALVSRVLFTMTTLLQAAQAQGDEKAADALRIRQMSR